MMVIDIAFLAASALLLLGNLALRIYGGKRHQFSYNIALLAILIVITLAEMQTTPAHTLFGVLSVNPFSLFFMLVFTAGMLAVNLLAYPYSEHYGDFAVLATFALAGMYILSLSNSLLTIFIGLELSSLPAIFMILLSRRSIEAATKFFIMASIAIALLSFAIVLFYGGTGTLSFGKAPSSSLLLFAVILFIASLGIDSSIFPFNLLIPDVYEGAPAYVTSMLGGLNKKVAFVALIQVLILLFIGYRSSFEFIAILSVITMFFGNIVAMMQKNLKRMLAYSSISQGGYILIGIATSTASGLSATLFQIFSHAFAFIGILGIVAWLESKNKTRIEDLAGLSEENRFAAFSLTLFMLAFVGLPFTTGFVGKFLLFLGAVNAGLAWLAVIGIINSVISIYYYARPIMSAYAGKNGARRISMPMAVYAATWAMLALTVVFGVYPQPIIGIAHNAAAYLFSI